MFGVGEDGSTLAAIATMAAVTLACRCGGYFLFAIISPSPALRTALAYLPGCIFVAYVVPALIDGPVRNWLGAAVTILIMGASRNLGLSIVAGVAAAWLAAAIS